MSFESVILLYLLISTTDAVATCYLEGNHEATGSIFVPCNSNQPFSMCYRTQNDSTIQAPPDIRCLSNGLAEGWDGVFWRESCTDPTWQSPYCLTAFSSCPSDENGNAPVTPCNNDPTSLNWCCGIDNSACCGTSEAIVIAAVLGPSNTASSSTKATTAAISPATSSFNSPPVSSSSSSSSHHRMSPGDIAGTTIAVVFTLLCVTSAIWAYFVKPRKRKRDARDKVDVALANSNEYSVGELEDQKVTTRQVAREIYGRQIYEADGRYHNTQRLSTPAETLT